MKKKDFKILLLAATLGMAVPVATSCSNDDTSHFERFNVLNTPGEMLRFEGQWLLNGQNIGRGTVCIDSTQVLLDFPVADIISAVLANVSYINGKPNIQATAARQQMEAKYVGVSQTSVYYDLPATQMSFKAIVDRVAYDVKLQTAAKGSVVLLQEEKHSLSVVVKVEKTIVEQSDNGMIVADSQTDHTLIFESDI